MNNAIAKTLIRLTFFTALFSINSTAQQTDIVGPAGSDEFGAQVFALPSGNIVVTDPFYDIPAGASNVGAVYLYNGATAALISTLTGSTTNDRIGNGGVTVLTNGNYVIRSNDWTNVAATEAGAATFGNATTGVSGVVSPSNSLVGTQTNDDVAQEGIIALPTGNYLVLSRGWDNGGVSGAGAVTFGDGTSGVSGIVSAANSLVGSSNGDLVGGGGVIVLTNGNYVVKVPGWDAGATMDVGAAAFGNGTSGVSGPVSSSNSLVGASTLDRVGLEIIALSNGNYVVSSYLWDGTAVDVGAVTFGNGTTGISGVVSSANSLVGSTAVDSVGQTGVTALTNGNYVVRSASWDGAAVNIGAVTWGNGTTGITGAVSAANSLVGSTTGDAVGITGTAALSNGNYVVASQLWDGAAADVGAVTWGNGTTGLTGAVSAANSLVGSTVVDVVGSGGVTALTNGNYVVRSAGWDGAAVDTGAVTFGNGTTGTTGVVSSLNSLVGSTTGDGSNNVIALTNGNYVVVSSFWDGTATDVGAVTFGNGTSGVVGAVSPANSLVGSTANDNVGNLGVTALTNGNYVVHSTNWDGTALNVGAVTFGNGTSGTSGVVSSGNSLVGSTTNDSSGSSVTALNNGNYVVRSPNWDGTATNAGAVTFGSGTSGISGAISSANSLVGAVSSDNVGGGGVTALVGGNYVVLSPNFDNGGVDTGAISYLSGLTGNFAPIGRDGRNSKQVKPKNQTFGNDDLAVSMSNSVLGTATNGGSSMNFTYDPTNDQLVVGRPADNIVTIFKRFGITAAMVSVGGRVESMTGSSISGAIVTVTDPNGQIRFARTNNFGYFSFDEIEAGETYVFDVSAKGHTFPTQVVNIDADTKDIVLRAQ